MPVAKDVYTIPDESFKNELLQTLDRIRPYARRLTRDPQAAEDLLQDTVLRALERHYQWQRGTNLTAWLRTIMRHRHFECHRKKQPVYLGDDIDSSASLSHNEEQTVCVELRETGQAIERLGPEFRRVLEMVALDGASYEETAVRLHVPVGTIRSRLSRARTALRADLDSKRRYPVQRVDHHVSSVASFSG